jgi:hypothetical protein
MPPDTTPASEPSPAGAYRRKDGSPDPLIGRQIGQYVIVRPIGQGGMGVVYEARHPILDQRAAVKVLHKELASDERSLRRFFTEAMAISRAQHAGIVRVFDFGSREDGISYIMMEYLDGETLLSRMERAQKVHHLLPVGTIIDFGRQIADALTVIHEKGIVHRDMNARRETHPSFPAALPSERPRWKGRLVEAESWECAGSSIRSNRRRHEGNVTAEPEGALRRRTRCTCLPAAPGLLPCSAVRENMVR